MFTWDFITNEISLTELVANAMRTKSNLSKFQHFKPNDELLEIPSSGTQHKPISNVGGVIGSLADRPGGVIPKAM